MAKAILLGLHEIERHGTGVMGLQQLSLLSFQGLLAAFQSVRFSLPPRGHRLELGEKRGLDFVTHVLRKFDELVELDDPLLDCADKDRLLSAGGPLGMTAEAHEVRVDPAVTVLGVRDGHAALTAATEQA